MTSRDCSGKTNSPFSFQARTLWSPSGIRTSGIFAEVTNSLAKATFSPALNGRKTYTPPKGPIAAVTTSRPAAERCSWSIDHISSTHLPR